MPSRVGQRAQTATRGAWRALPDVVRGSRVMRGPRRLGVRLFNGHADVPAEVIAPPAPPSTVPLDDGVATSGQTVQVLRTLDELDRALQNMEQAAAVSDDELRREFRKYEMALDYDMPEDPFSEAYRCR